MTRVALISNLCPHYRAPLYEELARRVDLECYFFSEGEEYWNPLLPTSVGGAFRRGHLRRRRVLGEPVMPGLAQRLGRDRYDAVVMGMTGRLMTPFVYGVARGRRLPFVLWTGVWYHPRTPFHQATRPITEALYRRSDAIVVYGDHVRRALTGVRDVEDAKIFTAAQAVDASRFERAARPSSSNELVFVGLFQERKGIADLLGAMRLIPRVPLRLTFIGNGELQPAIEAAARVDSRITLAGHVPQQELPARLARTRALVLPSITTATDREPWGLVVNEAMHLGLPVIASDAVGAAAGGLVLDGSTGIVVPEHDRNALADAIRRLAVDDELADALGERGSEHAATFTYERMADAFEAAIAYARRRHG